MYLNTNIQDYGGHFTFKLTHCPSHLPLKGNVSPTKWMAVKAKWILGQNLVMQSECKTASRTIRLSKGESMGMDHETLLSGGLLDRTRLKDHFCFFNFQWMYLLASEFKNKFKADNMMPKH